MGKLKPTSYLQASIHLENGEFACAQRVMCDCLRGIYENVHSFSLAENLDNLYGVKVSVIIVSHRNWFESCEIRTGIEDYIDQQDVELIFIGNGLDGGEAAAGAFPDKARVFRLPGNIGCSAARNVGAYVARGDYLLFLDDDGETGSNDLSLLAGTCVERQALAVRGRIGPKSATGQSGAHYDLGDRLHAAPPTAEGFSVWQASAFERYGGFDPLLAGHEGMDLCCRMLGETGPGRFLYQPGALLRHDYAGNAEDRSRKEDRLALSDKYLAYKGTCKERLTTVFRDVLKDHAD